MGAGNRVVGRGLAAGVAAVTLALAAGPASADPQPLGPPAPPAPVVAFVGQPVDPTAGPPADAPPTDAPPTSPPADAPPTEPAPAEPPSPSDPELPSAQTVAAEARIAALLTARAAGPLTARWLGGAVVDVTSGRRVWELRPQTPMLPASVAKLGTAVTALGVLGAGLPLTTTVTTGRAPGEVVLTGGGDPGLRGTDLGRLADLTVAAVRASGRTSVRLAFDDTAFGWPTPAPGWPRATTPAQLPPVRPLVVDRHHVLDTGRDAALAFATMLRNRRLPVVGLPVRVGRWPGAEVLASVSPRTVGDVVRHMLQTSDNLDAEVLSRLSAQASGRPATWAGAAATQHDVLTALGVPLDGVVVRDGSGLSRGDRATAAELAGLLAVASDPARPELAALAQTGALPVAGVSGTLAPRYRRFISGPASCARGVVSAKTGSLHDVVTLAGLTTGSDGRRKAFAFLVNGPAQSLALRQVLDRLAATVTGCI